MADDKATKLVQNTFNLYGLMITKKLSAALAKNLIKEYGQNNLDNLLTKVIEHILSQNLKTQNVDIENIKVALSEFIKPESALKETETILNVINAFEIPKVQYDLNRQKYILTKVGREIFSDAEYKSSVFKERLDLLWYRTLKNPIFAPDKFGTSDPDKLKLIPIEYLLSESKTKDACIMGLLHQLTEGQFYLEDYTGAVKVNLKNTCFSSSLIMEGNIIIAKGKYMDEIFEVEDADFPPPQSSNDGRALFADANTFGGPHPTSLKLSDKMKQHEDCNKDEFIVFVSEFWVDSPIVLKKFNILLSGYSEGPPIAFVLCGHFLSTPCNAASVRKLKDGFKKVAEIILQYPLVLQNSHFIFVPGPYDLCAPKILPRPPIPKSVMEYFIKHVPQTFLATNPCRIQYCTKEIVVFRENMMNKICRNTLDYPSQEENEEKIGEKVYTSFAKSIIRQSHLCPLLFSVIPVHWKHDFAMHLYPTPDVIVVADDEFQPYATEYYDCIVTNPGSFVKTNFNFKCYTPALNIIEECNIPEDEEY